MALDRRRFLAAGIVPFVTGCAGIDASGRFSSRPISLPPLQLSPDRLMRITVCSRPFRPAGPRLEAEAINGKTVVHNYGHGGSGWSLSWGCAAEAAALALASGPQRVAVIGAGIIGLTTALKLAESGVAVTIYAKEFPGETRSSRATGAWSPSSRIALVNAVSNEFMPRWDRWVRSSYAEHQRYIGRADNAVEFLPQYTLADADAPPPIVAANAPRGENQREFFQMRIGDITPPRTALAPDQNPFPKMRTRRGFEMIFNIAAYGDRLTRDFLLRGGRMVRREFPDPAAVLALQEPVIVNCTGFGAQRLWGDQSLVPVRGQNAFLAPQPEARYGLSYRSVSVISRTDALVVQYTGLNEDFGFGDASETPDREETSRALTSLAPLFA